MAKFWYKENTEDLKNYINNPTERNYIKLRKPFREIAKRLLLKYNYNTTAENYDELESVMYNSIQHITIEKIDYALHYFYTAGRNYLQNRTNKNNKYNNEFQDYHYDEEHRIECNQFKSDYEIKEETKRNREIILSAIDQKIEDNNISYSNDKRPNKKKPNKHIAYLLLLKNYLIENDFDYRGFENYAIEKLNVSRQRYMQLSHHNGIKTRIFKENLIND